ncbi:MAG: polyprenyl synthetase family protein [Clostridia bacterium]
MSFKEQLNNYQKYVNENLEKFSAVEDVPEKRLDEACKYSLLAGGKRIRPILILSSFKLFSDEFEECIPFIIAMEMIHNFSLIHDDLPAIDNDDFRHSIPTNHKVFGESTAILAGDKLLNSAYVVLSKGTKNTKDIKRYIRAFEELTTATNKMISGEFVDIECENKIIENSLLEYMHKNKTGALIIASAKIGAILAGADESQIEILSQFAQRIGLAFQIKDDILSEIGDEKITGKPVGNDNELKKSTFVTMYGLQEAKNKLDDIISEAIDIINIYDKKAEFLKDLALYIKDRNS